MGCERNGGNNRRHNCGCSDDSSGSAVIAVEVDGAVVRVRLGGLEAVMVAWRWSWTHEERIERIVQVDVVPGAYGVTGPPFRRAKGGELRCAYRNRPALRVDIDGGTYRRLRLSAPDARATADALQAAMDRH